MKRALGFALALSFLALPVVHAESMDQVGEEMVKAVEDMATIVDNDKAKCDTMGDQLSSFADKNAALFAKGKEMEKKATPEQKKEWQTKYRARVMAAAHKMQPGLMACHTNAKVKAALEKLKMH